MDPRYGHRNFNASHLNSKRQFPRAYGVFEKLRREVIVSLDDVGGDKYFHCGFYDVHDQLNRKAFSLQRFYARA